MYFEVEIKLKILESQIEQLYARLNGAIAVIKNGASAPIEGVRVKRQVAYRKVHLEIMVQLQEWDREYATVANDLATATEKERVEVTLRLARLKAKRRSIQAGLQASLENHIHSLDAELAKLTAETELAKRARRSNSEADALELREQREAVRQDLEHLKTGFELD